jgi:serine protease SohB
MDHIIDIIVFLIKTIIITGGVGLFISAILASNKRSLGSNSKGSLLIKPLNKHFNELKQALEEAILNKSELKETLKNRKKAEKDKQKQASKKTSRLFVIDFKGDIKASAVESLREEITAIISIANPKKDSVAIRLESAGGMVNNYGLAASQLKRLQDAKIHTTSLIDKVAGSGGYLMACATDNIVAAPFSIIGSIGVVATLPNINKLLTKNNVDIEMHTSGEFKRTLTVVGKNTEQGRNKFIEDIQEIHQLFKNFVSEQRKDLDIEKVATGEIWLGIKAIEKNLIDSISTSDEYLYEKANNMDIFQVQFEIKKTLPQKLGIAVSSSTDNFFTNLMFRLQQRFNLF